MKIITSMNVYNGELPKQLPAAFHIETGLIGMQVPRY